MNSKKAIGLFKNSSYRIVVHVDVCPIQDNQETMFVGFCKISILNVFLDGMKQISNNGNTKLYQQKRDIIMSRMIVPTTKAKEWMVNEIQWIFYLQVLQSYYIFNISDILNAVFKENNLCICNWHSLIDKLTSINNTFK